MMINEKTGKYILCLLPFFEIYTLEVLISRGILARPLTLLTMLFSVARLLISLVMIAEGLFRNIFSITYTAWGIIFFSLLRIISCMLNGSFNTGMIIAAISYIGFVLLCENMLYESKKDFYKALFVVFGVYSILGALSIWLFPDGFFYAETKAQAIYFLGSKNSSFAYFLTFLFLWYVRNYERNSNLPKYGGIVIVIFMITETICDSSNAVLCLIILLVFHLLIKYNKKIYKCFSAVSLEVLVVIMGIAIIFGSTSDLLESIVNAIGRDMSFSGRNVLWKQALETIAASPIVGEGVYKSFVLATGVSASHAHCFYLDTFAKYGVICFGVIVGMITGVMHKLSKEKRNKEIVTAGMFVFVYLIHCITEDASIYVLSLLLILAESMCINERISYRKGLKEIIND